MGGGQEVANVADESADSAPRAHTGALGRAVPAGIGSSRLRPGQVMMGEASTPSEWLQSGHAEF